MRLPVCRLVFIGSVSLLASVVVGLGYAAAGLKVCNRSTVSVQLAAQVQDPSCTTLGRRKGWFTLAPCGGCAVVQSGPLIVGAPFYIYAKGSDGREWNGGFPSCTPRKQHSSCLAKQEASCSKDAPVRGFVERTPKEKDYTLNLRPRPSDKSVCID